MMRMYFSFNDVKAEIFGHTMEKSHIKQLQAMNCQREIDLKLFELAVEADVSRAQDKKVNYEVLLKNGIPLLDKK